eukprot:7378191-Prymnesium_polylepis.1
MAKLQVHTEALRFTNVSHECLWVVLPCEGVEVDEHVVAIVQAADNLNELGCWTAAGRSATIGIAVGHVTKLVIQLVSERNCTRIVWTA